MDTDVSRSNIWSFAQNKPSLVVRDLEQYVEADVVYRVLLTRGVFKWLAARRHIIRAKDAWKTRITEILADLSDAKRDHDGPRVQWLRGYLKGYEECRRDVRAICHGDRWQAPDNDRACLDWLSKIDSDQETW